MVGEEQVVVYFIILLWYSFDILSFECCIFLILFREAAAELT
jgi:hypothetical protein